MASYSTWNSIHSHFQQALPYLSPADLHPQLVAYYSSSTGLALLIPESLSSVKLPEVRWGTSGVPETTWGMLRIGKV